MRELLHTEGVLESPGRPFTQNPQKLVAGIHQLEEPALGQHSEGHLYLGKQAGDDPAGYQAAKQGISRVTQPAAQVEVGESGRFRRLETKNGESLHNACFQANENRLRLFTHLPDAENRYDGTETEADREDKWIK